jgi:hypothetical protein
MAPRHRRTASDISSVTLTTTTTRTECLHWAHMDPRPPSTTNKSSAVPLPAAKKAVRSHKPELVQYAWPCQLRGCTTQLCPQPALFCQGSGPQGHARSGEVLLSTTVALGRPHSTLATRQQTTSTRRRHKGPAGMHIVQQDLIRKQGLTSKDGGGAAAGYTGMCQHCNSVCQLLLT